ncbi:MAG: HD domain-containing protein [Spirochaetales bacterium]|nr:HD domain-containing protein [Spirochaetales bacterium]
MKFPEKLYRLAALFHDHGYQCFLVGGAVRDKLLGRQLSDFDIATDAMPHEVKRIFPKTIPTGIKHGTVTVLFLNKTFEVTTFRIDGDYSDKRRPDAISYTSSIYEDLKRRDFSINAIAYDLHTRKIVDPHHGTRDLKKKVIRAIGNPVERFNEDALRLLRACRFAAQLDFNIEPRTKSSMTGLAANITAISYERIRDELIKIVCSLHPAMGFELMKETGLLVYVLPELDACRGIEQGELHCFDVYYHSLYSCEAAPQDNLPVRIAALLHDIGKSRTQVRNENGEIRFYRHEKVSADMAREITARLRFSNNEIKKISHLILHHMFSYDPEWTDAAVRRFLTRVGIDHIADIIMLRRADQAGMCRRKFISKNIADFKKRIEAILAQDHALTLSDLAINGDDIINGLSIHPGPVVGTILAYLLEAVIEDPELNSRSRLLAIALRFYEDRLRKK